MDLNTQLVCLRTRRLVDLALTGTGNDYLDGGLGDDRLYGGDGTDTMIGGLGNDMYTVDSASDVVIEREAEGIDEVYLDITLSLHSYVENVTLTNSTEGVLGNALANRINGNASANYLAGAEGNDTITGGTGADRLIGGTGADTYVYNAVNEGGDRVLDFSSSDDTFHFRASAFGGLPTGQLDGSRFSSSNGDTAPNSTRAVLLRRRHPHPALRRRRHRQRLHAGDHRHAAGGREFLDQRYRVVLRRQATCAASPSDNEQAAPEAAWRLLLGARRVPLSDASANHICPLRQAFHSVLRATIMKVLAMNIPRQSSDSSISSFRLKSNRSF